MKADFDLFPDNIFVSRGALHSLKKVIKTRDKEYSRVVLITDEKIYPLYNKAILAQLHALQLNVDFIILPPGESVKHLDSISLCWKKLSYFGADRHTLVISLGGGTICDIAGFVASTYMRGIDVLHIPTTLLAMVDASIGGKTGINLGERKNCIGTFYHPLFVLADIDCLNTLPQREYVSGLAEVIKYAVIADANLLKILEKNAEAIKKRSPSFLEKIIFRCCQIKYAIVKQDENDVSIRNILNWGHTFGHALESISGYNTYLHGEAISIGMSCEALLSYHLKLASEDFVHRQDAICKQYGLPIELPEFNDQEFLNLIRKDKKAKKGKIACVVARDVMNVETLFDIPEEAIVKTIFFKRKNPTKPSHDQNRSSSILTQRNEG